MLSSGIEWVLRMSETSDSEAVGSSVCITFVEPGSPAWFAGLAEGDIITSVDSQAPSNETMEKLSNRSINWEKEGRDSEKEEERKSSSRGGQRRESKGLTGEIGTSSHSRMGLNITSSIQLVYISCPEKEIRDTSISSPQCGSRISTASLQLAWVQDVWLLRSTSMAVHRLRLALIDMGVFAEVEAYVGSIIEGLTEVLQGLTDSRVSSCAAAAGGATTHADGGRRGRKFGGIGPSIREGGRREKREGQCREAESRGLAEHDSCRNDVLYEENAAEILRGPGLLLRAHMHVDMRNTAEFSANYTVQFALSY